MVQELYDAGTLNTKYIPVLWPPAGAAQVPLALRGSNRHDLGSEEGYQRLYRHLTGQPSTPAPPLGARVPMPPRERKIRFSAPQPRYEDARTRELGEQLAAAQRRFKELTIAGGDVSDVREQILGLKRSLRDGERLQAGDWLAEGRFQLLEPAGHGGFATVWKAWDEERQALVAVKVLHGLHAEDRTRRERFFRGALKMAELRHPGIVRVIEAELEENGKHFFVMDYVGGGDLRRAVLAGELAPVKVLPVILAVGEALAHAHGKGIIHRDVKPANILLDGDRPKLTDFDLVRAFDTTGGTQTQGMLGTVLYTAPEMLGDAKNASAAVDVYSLAMTAVFAFHGRDLPLDVWRRPEAVLEKLPCSPALRKELGRGISWESENRPGSVAELCEELRGCLRRPDSRSPHPLVPSPTPSPQPGEGEIEGSERGRPSPGRVGGGGSGDGGEWFSEPQILSKHTPRKKTTVAFVSLRPFLKGDPQIEYEDFVVRVAPDPGGDWVVQVLYSPAGQGESLFRFPWKPDELPRIHSEAGETVWDVSCGAPQASAREVGQALYQSLFSGHVAALWMRSLGRVPEQGLRLQLRFRLHTLESVALHGLPWELLYAPGTRDYLALSRVTPVIRYLEVPRSLPQAALPKTLRILAVVSNPMGLLPLKLERERRAIEKAWGAHSETEVVFLDRPQPGAIREALLLEQFHILHFIGHGRLDRRSGTGELFLEGSGGGPMPVSSEELATQIKDIPGLRLVFLNVCETAATLAEVATALVLAGIPAVIAMQMPVSDSAAVAFCRAVHLRLAKGDPLDMAVTEGRQAVYSVNPGTAKWAIPVLFTRVADGRIFESAARRPWWRPRRP